VARLRGTLAADAQQGLRPSAIPRNSRSEVLLLLRKIWPSSRKRGSEGVDRLSQQSMALARSFWLPINEGVDQQRNVPAAHGHATVGRQIH
jgi:hypothetical protein